MIDRECEEMNEYHNIKVYLNVRIETIADSSLYRWGGADYVRGCTQVGNDILARTEKCGIGFLTEYILEYVMEPFNQNERRMLTALDVLLIGLNTNWSIDAKQSQKLLDLIANSEAKLESLPKVKISLDRVLAVLRAKCLGEI